MGVRRKARKGECTTGREEGGRRKKRGRKKRRANRKRKGRDKLASFSK